MKKGLIIVIATILLTAIIFQLTSRMQQGELRAQTMLLKEIRPELTIQEARYLVGRAIAVLRIHDCQDTDFGLDYPHFGQVTVRYSYGSLSATKTFEDQCTNKNLLFENYCKDGKYFNIFNQCKYGCKYGECLDSPEDENAALKCKDYDGGIDYYSKSWVYGLDRYKTLQVANDSCFYNNAYINYCYGRNCQIKEFGCRGDYITSYAVNCTYGCEYGACRTTKCSEEGELKVNGCCLGLSTISANRLTNNSCRTTAGQYCTKCGNGVCEYPENLCNCLTDCPATCTDTDGGADYYVKGTARSNAPAPNYNNVTDYCTTLSGQQYVQEAVCQTGGIIGISSYRCANGCANGSCKYNTGINISNETTCTDSDGLVFYTKGIVSGKYRGSSYSYEDSCFNSTTVTEYYCSANTSRSMRYYCTRGCSNGTCQTNTIPYCGNGWMDPGERCDLTVPPAITCQILGFAGGTVGCKRSCELNTTLCIANSTTCTDTDLGRNSTVRGTTCVGSDCRTDFCDGNDYVLEFFCGAIARSNTRIRCTGGCVNGQCTTQFVGCIDTDGRNYTVQGINNDQYGTWTDYCRYQENPLYTNTRGLVEYYCENNLKIVSEYNCTTRCVNGICI